MCSQSSNLEILHEKCTIFQTFSNLPTLEIFRSHFQPHRGKIEAKSEHISMNCSNNHQKTLIL